MEKYVGDHQPTETVMNLSRRVAIPLYLCRNVGSHDEPIIMKTYENQENFVGLHSCPGSIISKFTFLWKWSWKQKTTSFTLWHVKRRKRYSRDNVIDSRAYMCISIVLIYQILHVFHRSLPPQKVKLETGWQWQSMAAHLWDSSLVKLREAQRNYGIGAQMSTSQMSFLN